MTLLSTADFKQENGVDLFSTSGVVYLPPIDEPFLVFIALVNVDYKAARRGET